MINKKRAALLLTLVLTAGLFNGCGWEVTAEGIDPTKVAAEEARKAEAEKAEAEKAEAEKLAAEEAEKAEAETAEMTPEETDQLPADETVTPTPGVTPQVTDRPTPAPTPVPTPQATPAPTAVPAPVHQTPATPAPTPKKERVWVEPIYQDVYHDEVGHYETVSVPVQKVKCACGAVFNSAEEHKAHQDAFIAEMRQTDPNFECNGTHTARYVTLNEERSEYVVDQPAYTEQVLISEGHWEEH